MNEQAIEKAIEVYLGPDCYTEADVEAVRPHLIEAIAAYLGTSGAGRDAEIERLTASLVHWKRLADEACRGEMLALKEKHDLRAKLEAAERDAERYREWKRAFREGEVGLWNAICEANSDAEHDAAIDAARGGERG